MAEKWRITGVPRAARLHGCNHKKGAATKHVQAQKKGRTHAGRSCKSARVPLQGKAAGRPPRLLDDTRVVQKWHVFGPLGG